MLRHVLYMHYEKQMATLDHNTCDHTLLTKAVQQLPSHVQQRIYTYALPTPPVTLRTHLHTTAQAAHELVQIIAHDVERRFHVPRVIPSTTMLYVDDGETRSTHVHISDVMWYRGGKGVCVSANNVKNDACWVFVGSLLRALLRKVKMEQRWERHGRWVVWLMR